MTIQRFFGLGVILIVGAVWVGPVSAADEPLPDGKVLLRALVDELERSKNLQMEDLEKPYFIQFDVEDTISYQIAAAYGSITTSQRDRSRDFRSRVRVGSPDLDNTNFVDSSARFGGGGDGGGRTSLPLDDDYLAIRQAVWQAVDEDYKDAVETLTKKRAYMKDKNIVDRPKDFSEAPVVEEMEPSAVMRFDRVQWEDNLRKISAHFKKYEQVQESGVRLMAAGGNSYTVNTEGTRLRTNDTGALLLITAQVQAEDGMKLSNSRSYSGESTGDFPPLDKIIADVDEMVAQLTEAMKASIIDHYSGPVLFDDLSSAQMFQAMLAGGVVAKPDQVGEQRRTLEGAESLENKLGTRILPKSFHVWDDPTTKKVGDQVLFGWYRYDQEGVAAKKVDIVTEGKLEGMCLSRAPTKKLSGSNGHARRASGGPVQAAIGSLFVKDDDAVPADKLKAELLTAAKEAGLEYGIRVKSLRATGITSTRSDLLSFILRAQRGRAGGIGDPIIAYKVYVADGREEPFRGCEFGQTEVTALKRILAAGDKPCVYNYVGLGMGGATPASAIIAPPVLFEELELSKIQQEFDKLPILSAPLFR